MEVEAACAFTSTTAKSIAADIAAAIFTWFSVGTGGAGKGYLTLVKPPTHPSPGPGVLESRSINFPPTASF